MFYSAYEWNSCGEPGDVILFEGNEYYQTDEHMKTNEILQYAGSTPNGNRVFTSPHEGSCIYVQRGNVYIAYKTLEADLEICYKISDCLKFRIEEKGIELEIIENSIYLEHTMEYYCCADLEMDTIIDGNQISIFIINHGDVCRCMCDYRLETEINNMPSGDYHICLCGILMHEYGPQYSDYAILWDKDITIP